MFGDGGSGQSPSRLQGAGEAALEVRLACRAPLVAGGWLPKAEPRWLGAAWPVGLWRCGAVSCYCPCTWARGGGGAESCDPHQMLRTCARHHGSALSPRRFGMEAVSRSDSYRRPFGAHPRGIWAPSAGQAPLLLRIHPSPQTPGVMKEGKEEASGPVSWPRFPVGF